MADRPRPGAALADTIIQSAQLILAGQRMRQEHERREAALQERERHQDELFKYREQTLKYKEDSLKLQKEREDRLEGGQAARLDIQERNLKLKEKLGEAKLDKSAPGSPKKRREVLQMVEEDAAVRAGAPEEMQFFTDNKLLINERNRIERMVNENAIFAGADPKIAEMVKANQNYLGRINKELLERGKFKRDTLMELGEPTTLDRAKQYLPDLDESQPAASSTPSATAPIDQGQIGAFDKAVSGALGKDPTFAPDAAVQSFRSEVQRLKGEDPTGGKVQTYKRSLYNNLRGSHKLSKEQAVKTLQEWGLP